MYKVLNELLKDKSGDVTFNCFGLHHIIYIVLGILLLVFLILVINKKQDKKETIINIVLDVALGLYILDFFLMPLAYGEIDIEKLPFHACTCMCVMSFLSRRIKWLFKFKNAFAMLGLISNMVYFFYPAGVMWYHVSPFCYRVIQTLLYHYVMMVYGILVLVYERTELSFKDILYDIIAIVAMTIWALIGNLAYNNIQDSGRIINWFFVVKDPFGLINPNISKYIMPFITPIAFIIVVLCIYTFIILIRKIKTSHANIE